MTSRGTYVCFPLLLVVEDHRLTGCTDNLRYAVDVCLFSNSTSHNGSSSSPVKRECDLEATCGPLKPALQSNIKSPSGETEFEYCTADNRAFQGKVTGECTQCLRQTTDKTYLSNCTLPMHTRLRRSSIGPWLTRTTVMTALQAGCQQQPKPGVLLGLSGTVFQLSAITMTTPTPTPQPGSTGLTLTAIIGISVGAASAFLIGAILFIIYWRRQVRYKAEDQAPRSARYPVVQMGFPPQGPMTDDSTVHVQDHFLSSPHYTHDYKRHSPDLESNATTAHEKHGAFEHTFASNAEYYDQMSNNDAASTVGGAVESVAAMPAHPAYIPRTLARPSRTESPKPRAAAFPTQPQPAAIRDPRDSYALRRYLASAEEPTGSPPPRSPPSSSHAVPQSTLSGVASGRPTSPPARTRPTPIASPARSGIATMRPTPPVSPEARSTRAPPKSANSVVDNGLASPDKAPSVYSNVSVVPSLILPNMPGRKGRRHRGASGAAGTFRATMAQREEGRDISAPQHAQDEERFGDRRPGRVPGEQGSDDDKIVEQTLVRPTRVGYSEVPIASGKSFLYG